MNGIPPHRRNVMFDSAGGGETGKGRGGNMNECRGRIVMIHVTLKNGRTVLFQRNEKVQAAAAPFVKGEFVEKKYADLVKSGEFIRWHCSGLAESVEVVRVRVVPGGETGSADKGTKET
jgi:hypothetical protein